MKYLLIILTLTFSCAGQDIFLKNERTGLPLYLCDLKKNYPILVEIAADIPLEDIQVIQEAISIWNTALETEVFLYIGMSNWTTVEMPEPTNHISIGVVFLAGELGDNTLAHFERITDYRRGCLAAGKIIYVPDMIGSNPLRRLRTIAHELGHSLCLAHSNKLNNLMYESIPLEMGCTSKAKHSIPVPTKEQVQALKNMYNLE